MYIDVDARRYGDPGAGRQTLDVPFEAGTFLVTPICAFQDPHAEFTAWNSWDPPTQAWESGLTMRATRAGFYVFTGRISHMATPAEACTDPWNYPVAFTLPEADIVQFYVRDYQLATTRAG